MFFGSKYSFCEALAEAFCIPCLIAVGTIMGFNWDSFESQNRREEESLQLKINDCTNGEPTSLVFAVPAALGSDPKKES
jgi:hypothetical protein